MKNKSLRAAAPLLLAIALIVPTHATSATTGGSDSNTDAHTAPAARASYKAPKVRVKITLSSVGDRLTGAKIPIKGYLSGNTERGKKTIQLQQKVGGKWKARASKKQKKLGAYSLRSQRMTKPGKVKYRTTVSLNGKLLGRSNTITVNVVKGGDTPTDPDDTTAPAIPTGLAATPGDTRVTVKWNAVPDKDLAHYTVYWSLPGQTATEVNTTSTSYTVTGLKNNTEYFFSVQSVDKSDNKSKKSEVVAATPVPAIPPDTTPPPVPTGLTATAGNGQVVLSWTAVNAPDLAGYTVYRSTSGATAIETNTTATTLTVTGLTNGTEYFFTVVSYDTVGNKSAKSNEVAATPAAEVLTQQRVIDGENRCHVLEIQTLNQERTSTDGGATWSEWTTVSEGVRAASAADCLNIVDAAPADALLPDMRMRNLDVCSQAEKDRNGGDCFGIYVTDTAFPGIPVGTKLLKFPILTLNVGPGSSEVIADRSAASASDWKAYQTFYDAEGNRESVLSPNAEFYFAGDGHSHWHIRDFDNYRILDALGGELRVAEKHGYCLEDNTPYGGMQGQPGVSPTPVYEHSKVCGLGLPNALTIVHGMSRGWGDTYPTTLPDQGIDITGLPDGTYTIEVTADDKNVVTESNDGNNTASVRVVIAGMEATVVAGTADGGIP